MEFNFKEIMMAIMILFAVINTIGRIPIIIRLKQKAGRIQSEKESIVAMLIVIIFFLGIQILILIGIDVYSFAVACSLVFLFIALEIILGVQLFKDEAPETTSVVPLAFSLIAGAGGTMTTILSMKADFKP